MKHILIIALMLCSIANAQDYQKSNRINLISAPGAYEDGYNIGLQYEYFNRAIYVGPEVFVFPSLNNIDYLHMLNRFGLNLNLDKLNLRFYSGTRAGLIFRGGKQHAILGLEAGFDYTIPSTDIFIGGSITSDLKADSKLWSDQDNHTVNAVFIKLGIKF